MKQAWQTAVMTAVATIAMGATMGCAADSAQVPKFLKYQFDQNDVFDPAYTIAVQAMAPLYRGTDYEPGGEFSSNPSLDIAQVDLNGDRMDEIIATPVESTEEPKPLCNADKTCPFYIIEVREKKVHQLGIINAFTVDRGDDVQNGYWTLTVYKQKADGTPVPYTYVYDRKKDGYVPMPPSAKASPPPPSPQSKP